MSPPLPAFVSPIGPPSVLAMLRHAISDPARVIPAAIYDDWALKLPGPWSPLVVAQPDAVRDILLDKSDTFGRSRQLRTLMRRAWGGGLAAAEGETWVAQRRAASTAFRPQAIEAAIPAMAAATRSAIARWPVGEPVDLQIATGRIVARIVMATLLGGRDGLDTDAIAADIPHVVQTVAKFGLLDIAPLPDRWLDRLRGAGRSDGDRRLRAIAARIAALRANAPDAAQDLPALLRGIGPLADNIFGFMIAGFETSALGAAWAVYLLARHPQWQQAVCDEAVVAGSADSRPLARAVVQEALRLYPPAPLLVRAALRDTSVLGFTLRRGQAVIVPVFAIQRHRRLWEHPDLFDPGRFAPAMRHDRGAYLPFGAGPRLCIAAGFALTEIATIVSELTRAFHFTPAPGATPHVSLKVSTHSTTGLHVVARRRT